MPTYGITADELHERICTAVSDHLKHFGRDDLADTLNNPEHPIEQNLCAALTVLLANEQKIAEKLGPHWTSMTLNKQRGLLADAMLEAYSSLIFGSKPPQETIDMLLEKMRERL